MRGLTTKSDNRFCCVPQCTVKAYKCPTLSFHGIPKDEHMKKVWLVKIRRDEGPLFRIRNWTRVCSRHFVPEDFRPLTLKGKQRRLKPDAVPSLFTWNNFQREKERKQPAVRHPLSQANINTINQRKNVDAEPATAHAEPATAGTEPATADAEPATADAEPATADTEPATADTEPATADTEPATADTEPETADTEPSTVSNLSIEEQLSEEKEKNKVLEERVRQLEQRLQTESSTKIEKFGLERFANDDAKIEFYTGFPNYNTLKIFYRFIEPHAKVMYQAYGKSQEKVHMRRPNGNMKLIDELFMFLVRLRLGLLIIDISDRFAISASTVSTKINAWANFLYTILGSMNIWLSREEINEYMPDDFRASYPTTRVIVDCTELFMQNPSSLVRSSQFYSNYKGQATLKSLIGISPHGSVTFVSKLYSGSMSDAEITQLSGLIDLLEPGDSVMSDKGFNIQNILAKKDILLNMPAFLSGKGQFSENEVTANQCISSLRVHVERAIRRVKEYRLFHGKIPLTLCGSLNQLWTVAVLLTNFKPPLVTKYAPSASYDPDQEM